MRFLRRETYLDWAAAAPVTSEARRALVTALRAYANPSAPHAAGVAARAVVEHARTRIARLAGTKPDAVIFTSGATESNNLAIHGHVNQLIASGRAPGTIMVLYLPTAHSSTTETLAALARTGVVTAPLQLVNGAIDIPAMVRTINVATVLVCIDAVCSETGARYDTRAVGHALEQARIQGIHALLHVDATQMPLVESFALTRLGADSVTLDAQKVGGVRGIGALIARNRSTLAPIIYGGGQEGGLRSGTEMSALASSFATALEMADAGRTDFAQRARKNRMRVIHTLSMSLPHVLINEGAENAPHILSLSLPGFDTDYLVMLLDRAGFAVSTKSACETEQTGSRVVLAMTGDAARADATLRMSWGPSTRTYELMRCARAVVRNVRFLEQHPVY